EPRARIADLPQEDREFIETLPLPGLFHDRLAHEFQPLLVQLGEPNRVELAQRLDLRVVERLEEPMAVVRLPSKVVFQLLELPLVLGEDERVLIDRCDLLMDPGERLPRARRSRAVGGPPSFPSTGPFPPGGDRGLRFLSRGWLAPARVWRRSDPGLGLLSRGPPGLSAASTGPRGPPTTEPIVRASPRGPSSPGSRLRGRPGVARRALPAPCALGPKFPIALAMRGGDRALLPARRSRPPLPACLL